MNRVVIQKGYTLPFAGAPKRRKSRSRRKMPGAVKRQQSKMKACAKKWNGKGSYVRFMSSCLKK
jgi:hypothetical protein